MQEIFKEAECRRRGTEYILTSKNTNCVYYGSPAWVRKREIWPPIASVSGQLQDHVTHHPISEKENPPSNQAEATTVTEELREWLTQLSNSKEVPYHALHNGDTIRILELHPGQQEDPLICSFRYVSLQHLDTDYEALSYVWGKPKLLNWDRETNVSTYETFPITCNGHERHINANLDRALRQLRYTTKDMFLWVDALCINQDDHTERGHQVALMGSIYKKAKRVIIWINERDERYRWDSKKGERIEPPPILETIRAQRAFGALCDIVNRWKGPEADPSSRAKYTIESSSSAGEFYNSFEAYPPVSQDFEDQESMKEWVRFAYPIRRSKSQKSYRSFYPPSEQEKEEPPHDFGIDSLAETAGQSQFWLSIADLFGRSWFWRVWVIQEAVVGQAAVVRWANVEIDWRWVGLAAAILRTSYHGICERLQIGGVYNAYLIYRMSHASDLPRPQLSFVQLLRLTRQFEATDPRDRIYGLLGMSTTDNDPENGSMFLRPDYTINAHELWTRFARQVILTSGNLSLLSSVQYSTDQAESEDTIKSRWYWNLDIESEGQGMEEKKKRKLPSWVPNWSNVFRSTLGAWDVGECFETAKGFPLRLNTDLETSDILSVDGIRVGTVGYGGVYMWRDIDTSLLFSKSLSEFFTSKVGLQLLAKTYTAGRNTYGSLTTRTDDTSLYDLAAYIMSQHEKTDGKEYRSSGEINYDALDFRQPLSSREAKAFDAVFDVHPEFQQMLTNLAKSGNRSKFSHTAVTICDRRRLFLTLNGFLGLAPDTTREGDILAVLSGGDVPVLLRPINKVESPDETESKQEQSATVERHLLVGECFVEGLMHGEVVQSLKRREPLIGPVPTTNILQEIISHGNQPEKEGFGTIFETERKERKRKRLEEGRLFTVEMLEQYAEVRPCKEVFNIW
ncbi:hypothetical protein CC80DRAFT_550173 [Byssothecium circinans]|uniref:Heterokaryon incompatibility domain-containing protein n=1 Tax=Byssothecium circinans TaxID=147558 RepID=A0A6A5U037_9PLEO|nr:hypothetical protein CC80DRAFT_550173 [Byssothecium circinans]